MQRPKGPPPVPAVHGLHTASRAELRAAIGAISQDENSMSDAAHAARLEKMHRNMQNPHWPHAGPTVAREPSFATTLRAQQKPRATRSPTKPASPARTLGTRHGAPVGPGVFERLAQPRGLVRTEVELGDTTFTRQPRYTGRRTVPREFALSVTNVPPAPPVESKEAGVQAAAGVENYDPNRRTEVRPFRLESAVRHEAAKQQWRDSVAREEEMDAVRRKYRALPLRQDMLDGPTFVPRLPPAEEVVTTAGSAACRNSSERAERRMEYNAYNAQRIEAETELVQRAQEMRDRAEEEAAAEEWRLHAFRSREVPNSHYNAEELPRPEAFLAPTSPHTPAITKAKQANGIGEDADDGVERPRRAMDFDRDTEAQ